MTETICQFSFELVDWKIVCDKVLEIEDWCQNGTHWYSGSFPEYQPAVPFLSSLRRRRLNLSARLFFEAAWNLLPNNMNVPLVYASLNGEINRNFQLWHELLTENMLSPISFSLSVHNALVGQWSELRGTTAETIAITANQDNLEIALLEAYTLLNEGHQKVLVVCSESPLENKYNVPNVSRPPFSYSLALLITKGKQYHLSLNNTLSMDANGSSGLVWVQQHYLNNTRWTTRSSRGKTWLWCKN